jgi:hypothetical protein
MLRNVIATVFIFCSVVSTMSEFVLSFPSVSVESVTEFVSEISYMLPFFQAMAFISGIYLVFFLSKIKVIKSAAPSYLVNTEEKHGEAINKEIEEKETSRIAAITDAVNKKIAGIKENVGKAEQALWVICNEFNLSQGLIYKSSAGGLELLSSYAFMGDAKSIEKIEIGIGITGQSAKNGEPVYIEEVPKGYLKVVSGLGEAYPDFILISPVKNEKSLIGMVELAGMGKLSTKEIEGINQLLNTVFVKLLSK